MACDTCTMQTTLCLRQIYCSTQASRAVGPCIHVVKTECAASISWLCALFAGPCVRDIVGPLGVVLDGNLGLVWPAVVPQMPSQHKAAVSLLMNCKLM